MTDGEHDEADRKAAAIIDEQLVQRLVDGQFPQWAELPISRVELDGHDNRTFRLGPHLTVRMPTGSWCGRR